MSPPVPPLTTVSDLSVEWLSTALNDTSIKNFSAERIGTGQVSFCYRVRLERDGTSTESKPSTVVVKMPSSDPQSRGSGLGLGLYEKESKFCRELAPTLDTKSLAKCHYSHFENGTFSILMEDAVGATVGDELVGATIEQARVAVTELGKIHKQLTMKPIQERAPWILKKQSFAGEVFRALYTSFLDAFESRLEPEHVALIDRLLAGWDSYNKLQEDFPQGLVHGDYRLDNLLFGKDAVTIVDWQTVTTGAAMTDLAYFMGCSLHVKDRRQYQDELTKLYLSALGGEMTLEQARQGIRLQSLFGVFMAVVSSMLVERTPRGDEMFMAMLYRHCAQVLDLDALSLLPERADLARPWVEPEIDDEGRHKPGIEYLWNESWYFDVIDEKQEIGCYIRMGLYPNQNSTWYTAVICGPKIRTVAVLDYHAPLPDENLVLQGEELVATQTAVSPLKTYRATLEGTGKAYESDVAMEEESDAPSVPVSIDLTWTTVCKPYKWHMTTRYEIPCQVSGSIKFDQESYNLNNCVGQRDHSWGVRDWWGLDWMWSAFHLSDSKRIHAVNLRFDKMADFSLGYVQDEQISEEIADMKTAKVMTKNALIDSTNMRISSAGGQEFGIHVKPVGHGSLLLRSFDGRISKFSRAWAKIDVDDGRKGVGWFEFNDALSGYQDASIPGK